MKREEATGLLREIIDVCDGISENSVTLMPPNADDVLPHGYQLHIKSHAPLQNYPCINELVEKRGLSIASEAGKDLIVLYRPK